MVKSASTPAAKKPVAKTSSDAAAKKPAAKKKTVAATPSTKAKPAAKTSATVPKKTAAAKPGAPKADTSAGKVAQPAAFRRKPAASPEERYRMIATAAYYLAECRGFVGGYEMADWITAEIEIDRKIKS